MLLALLLLALLLLALLLLHGLLELVGSLACFVERRLGLLRGRVGVLLLQAVAQRLEILCELLRPLIELLHRIVARLPRVGALALRLREIARFVLQRLHGPLKRRAFQNFRALLKGLAHFFLLLGELGERLLRLFSRELLRRILEFLERFEQLRRECLSHQVLGLLELLRERRVEHAGLPQTVFQQLGRLLHLLHPLRHVLLLLRKRLCLLRPVELHRLRLARLRVALCRRVRRALLQLLHGLRESGDTRRRRIRRRTRRAALIVRRGNLQHDFAAHPFQTAR